MENEKVAIELDIKHHQYDECNALVLPSKKNSTAKESKVNDCKSKNVAKPSLSKKRRKKLEKVLARKNKKFNRAKLISDLQECQVNQKEYHLMPSTSVMQTVGRKRINDLISLYKSLNQNQVTQSTDDNEEFRYRKIPKIKMKSNEKNFNRKNPNLVGFDNHSSEDEVDDSDASGDSDHQEEEKEPEPANEIVAEKAVINSTDLMSQPTTTTTETTKITKLANEQKKPVTYVPVNRPDEIQNARLELPILAEEQPIMEAIMYNSVVIICGETGSGKTTQVPQFLYEAGYTLGGKMIGVTEPRRVAAISMSKRVRHELCLTNREVSYQVRFESNATEKTAIKFMTDGILLKEIQSDFLLRKYSAIIIDEAHERSLYSDILIGFLSRVIQTREKQGDPLKLIIMSATLRVENFTENSRLFKKPPPVIKIDSRQYPVSVHFSKKTNENYVKEAYKKVCKIHSSFSAGGILVFLTGRQEVESLCKMLKEKFPSKTTEKLNSCQQQNDSPDVETLMDQPSTATKLVKSANNVTVNLDLYSVMPTENERVMDDFDYSDSEPDNDDDDDGSDISEADEAESDLEEIATCTDQPLHCLPLYSMLPNYRQALVFKEPPIGTRLCVVATNVAETSLTIPNIKYVIDSGKVKNKLFDNTTGISTFVVEWVSKASADQRAGRAGRTSAGHCYRLYSSAVYNDQFNKYSQPEILIKPIDDVILQMKAIGIDNVANFPFPSAPNVESILTAEKRLVMLQALKEEVSFVKRNRKVLRSRVTPLGRVMASFPVNPRYSKMLCLSSQSNLLPYTIAIIAGLTVQEIFIDKQSGQSSDIRKNIFLSNPKCQILGDLMAILSAVGAANFEGLTPKCCQHYGLRYNAMVEINKLRVQLAKQLKVVNKEMNISSELVPPSDSQLRLLRQLFLCGFLDHVAKCTTLTSTQTEQPGKSSEKKLNKSGQLCYQSTEVEDPVYIWPQSSLYQEWPQWVAYHDIHESGKMYMRQVVPIEPQWLPIYASEQCHFSNPLTEPPPRYDSQEDKVKCHRTSTFGTYSWPLPAVEVDYPESIDKYRYFAFFLFQGDILKWFGRYKNLLNTPVIVFTKTWAMVQPKVDRVVSSLNNNHICSKKALLEKWKNNNTFLLDEYLEWVLDSHKNSVRTSWPPHN